MRIMKIAQFNASSNKVILIIFLLILAVMEIMALTMESHYKYDIPMCAALLVFVYMVRAAIHLSWLHYLLFACFLIIHCLGMFDLYESYPMGIEYDYWVHSIFGFISALVILRWLRRSDLHLKRTVRIASTLVIVLGVSAAHELYEYAGAILLGSGEGVLFIGAGDLDQWDTQKDMLNNVIGGLIGILISSSYHYYYTSKST